jgi:hypothetical protein
LTFHQVKSVKAANAIVLFFELVSEGGVLLLELSDDFIFDWGFLGE